MAFLILGLEVKAIKVTYLTPNRLLVHTSFTYRKLNMDGFSVLNGSLGCQDSTWQVECNSLHAEGGIGKGKGSGIIHIYYIKIRNSHMINKPLWSNGYLTWLSHRRPRFDSPVGPPLFLQIFNIADWNFEFVNFLYYYYYMPTCFFQFNLILCIIL